MIIIWFWYFSLVCFPSLRKTHDNKKESRRMNWTNDLFRSVHCSHQWTRHSVDQLSFIKKELIASAGGEYFWAEIAEANTNMVTIIILADTIVDGCLLASKKWMDQASMDVCDLFNVFPAFYTFFYLFLLSSLFFPIFFLSLLLDFSVKCSFSSSPSLISNYSHLFFRYAQNMVKNTKRRRKTAKWWPNLLFKFRNMHIQNWSDWYCVADVNT